MPSLVQPRTQLEPVDEPTGWAASRVCPTSAIEDHNGRLVLDQGRCIGCGRCVRRFPELFAWDTRPDRAQLTRPALRMPPDRAQRGESAEQLAGVRDALAARTRALGRSVHIRHVDAGSDGAVEWEITALTNPVYDIHRLGFFFTASPRHADVLMVTGIGATGMIAPLRRTLEAMPRPVVVMAVGTDACSGGLLQESYAGSGGVGDLLEVDVWVPGSPPTPFSILYGLLLAVNRAPDLDGASR